MKTGTASACLAIAMLLLPLVAGAQKPPAESAPESIVGATSHLYKTIGDVSLRLHVLPAAGGSGVNAKPAIVFFFGGGWISGQVQQFVPQARHFAQRGLVSIVADYRVFGRHGTTPFEAMADARSAIRWVRTHAADLGVDDQRIVAAGGSAGGHLALSTAIFDERDEASEDSSVSSRPDVLLLFNPAVDTTGDPVAISKRFGDRPEAGSPIHHLRKGLPPTIIFHGKADTIVPYADVERFCAESQALGNRCELVGYEGAVHGFFNAHVANGKWYRDTLQEADRFLTRLGLLDAQAAAAP